MERGQRSAGCHGMSSHAEKGEGRMGALRPARPSSQLSSEKL